MQQAGRRSKRNAEDQALILALQNQVAEHNRAEATAAELARFLQGALEMLRMQAVHRSRRVQHLNN